MGDNVKFVITSFESDDERLKLYVCKDKYRSLRRWTDMHPWKTMTASYPQRIEPYMLSSCTAFPRPTLLQFSSGTMHDRDRP